MCIEHNRRIRQKKFVLSLLILGATAATIATTIASLQGSTKDTPKQIIINPKTKDDPASITIDQPPKIDKDMFKDLPPNVAPSRSVNTDPLTGGASHL